MRFGGYGEIASIEHTLARLTALLSQAESIPEIALTPALASYISDFYNGCERICQRVAVVLDESLPQGKDWHQELLNQMAQPGGHDRVPLTCAALTLNPSPVLGEGLANPAPLLPTWEKGLGDEGRILPN